MSEKLYTFTVPVTMFAVKMVYVKADNETEARKMLRDTDWYDEETDVYEEEYEWIDAELTGVQEIGE